MSSLHEAPELDTSMGGLRSRTNLDDHSISIYLRNWSDWHWDTEQVSISPQVIHFVEPNGNIVGLKVFSV